MPKHFPPGGYGNWPSCRNRGKGSPTGVISSGAANGTQRFPGHSLPVAMKRSQGGKHSHETAFVNRICRLRIRAGSNHVCLGDARRYARCSRRLRGSGHPSQGGPRSRRPYGPGRSWSSLRMGSRPRTSLWLAAPSSLSMFCDSKGTTSIGRSLLSQACDILAGAPMSGLQRTLLDHRRWQVHRTSKKRSNLMSIQFRH
jgi:hypothetical protein